ncbi:MAG: DHHA1 domain-containing protein [bacterium]
MKNIPRDSKVLQILHSDLDGSVCGVILSHVFDNIKILDTSFYRIDTVLENVNFDEYDFVFLTDISPEDKSKLNLSDKIILLDHHNSSIESNDPSKMHYVVNGNCAAYLVKKFVEKYYKMDLSHLNDLVELTNVYDMWNKEDPRFSYAKKLNDVMFFLYRPRKFREKFFDGRTTFTKEEEEWLVEREKKFERLYDELEVFEFEKINGCVTQGYEFINEIADKLMDEEGYQFVIVRNPKHGRISVRSRYEELDAGGLLKKLGIGGGHEKSAGGFSSDLNDFRNKVEIIEDEVYKIVKGN